MNNEIVAGILDTRTGEVIETTNNASAKTRLFLRVRDELNVEHGAGAFMVFEFNSMGGSGNLNYVRRNMQTTEQSALKHVELLKVRYNVANTRQSLDCAKSALNLTKRVRDECLALYSGDGNADKWDLVNDTFSTALDECQDNVELLNSQLTRQLKRLSNLESNNQ